MDEKDEGVYLSRVEDFNREGIIISRPTYVGGKKLLAANSQVYVQYRRPDAMYQFSAYMKPSGQYGDQTMQLYKLGNIERVQRRQYVRVNYRGKLKYALLKVIPNGMDQLSWHMSETLNLSAGGLLMSVDDDVEEKNLMLVRLDHASQVGLPGLVAAVCRRLVKHEERKFAGVEFITKESLNEYFSAADLKKLPTQIGQFNARMQNKLVRFVFDEQIRERQKGLL
ncbi:MAG: flagellar brake domain-containing protein [candidate division Zixibacteria bacterium]|nr:flagellar brake domain-containing protein [candidate division Zixibacteria bacterium]